MSGKRFGLRLALGLFLLGSALPAGRPVVAQDGIGSPATTASDCNRRVPHGSNASATPVGDSGITQELAAVVDAMVNCWNVGDWDGYGAFLTPDLMLARFGTSAPSSVASRLQALAARRLLGPITIDAAQYGRLVSDDAATIQVAWSEGFARFHESWSFVRGKQTWELYTVAPLEIVLDAPAVGLRIELTDNGIASPLSEIAQTALTVLQGVNETGGPFVMTVFALTSDTDPTAIVTGAPAEIFGGSVPIDSETSRELVLENLPPGNYVIATGLEAAIATNDPSLFHWVRLAVTASDGT